VKLRIVPTTLKQANKLVTNWHRHHHAVVGHRWSVGLQLGDKLVGAAIVGRPVAHMTPQYTVAEITRVVTDGSKNACSKLYGCVARICREMGFDRVQTSILATEPGTSLKAAGFKFSHITQGGDWNRPSRGGRRTDQPQGPKAVWIKEFRAAEESE